MIGNPIYPKGTIAPSSTPSEVSDWVSRVQGLGSDVSTPTQTAVSTFVNGLKSDGVWTKIKRMNIYAGNDITASKAPLVNTIGSVTDSLINFVASDYTQSIGLRGDGTSKYLNTGLSLTHSALGDNDLHMSCYARTRFDSGITMEVYDGTSNGLIVTTDGINSAWDCNNGTTARAVGIDPLPTGIGHYIGSRISSTTSSLYKDGVSYATNANAGGSRVALELYVHAQRNFAGGGVAAWTGRVIEMYSIGTGLTSTDATNFTNRYSTLRTALSRDVDVELNDWLYRVQAQGSDVTGSGVVSAVRTFINGLKSDGVWNKILRLNIYTGNDLNALKAPLKNNIGSVTDTLNNFVAGDYNQSTGLTGNGTNKYISTGVLSNDSSMGDNDIHLSAYTRTLDLGTTVAIGTTGPGSIATYLLISLGGTSYYVCNNQTTGAVSVADAIGIGHYIGSRIASNDVALYRNGSSIASGTGAAGSRSSYVNYVHCGNQDNVAMYFTSRTIEMYSIGKGLTATDVTNYTNRYSTLRTALGR